jgi:serine/threonine protein kinase
VSGLSDVTIRHLREVADWPSPGERYEVIEPIARGGMGKVYRARDHELERDVALKVLNLARSGPDAARRMVREARIHAGLEHPGIVPIHDVGRLADGRVFYTMKLVRGTRLDAFTREHADLDTLLRVFERICDAVAFAHAHGVIHRDLKPENVMVGTFGEVLVMDWGVAKTLGGREAEDTGARNEPAADGGEDEATGGWRARSGDSSRAISTGAETVSDPPVEPDTHPGTVLGTPGYMAPEQAAGNIEGIDERSDVYALGMILRGFVTAVGGKPRRPLLALIARATEVDPERRYGGVAQLADDVASFQAGRRVVAYRETAWEHAARVGYRFRTPILLILAYGLIRLLIFVLAGT